MCVVKAGGTAVSIGSMETAPWIAIEINHLERDAVILIIRPQRAPHALDIRHFSLVRPGGMMVAFRK
jgi:hypothetical protein